MSRISQFDNGPGGNLWNVKGDAELRIARRDGAITARSHGWFSRLIRRFGPTKQDRIDNRQIMGHLLADLQRQYGKVGGAAAFLEAVPKAILTSDLDIAQVPDAKPLRAQQVRLAQFKGSDLKTAAVKDAKAVATELGKDPVQTQGLATSFVRLATFTGTQREGAVRDGVWEFEDRKQIETMRSAKDPKDRETARVAVQKRSQLRYDNAVKLLQASKLARVPDRDLVGAAEQLVLQTGLQTGKHEYQLKEMIKNFKADSPSDDIQQLAQEIEKAGRQ